MIAHWLQLAAAGLFIVSVIIQMTQGHESADEDPPEPFGFSVKDGGTVDGGNYDGWVDE